MIQATTSFRTWILEFDALVLCCEQFLLENQWFGFHIQTQPKEFETRVTIIQRYPEMRTIEKTDFVKEIHHEDRTIRVPKTRVVMDEVEHIDRVPVVRQVPKTRIEIVHRRENKSIPKTYFLPSWSAINFYL